ncbi:UNVERIFIED_CONTAM: hypothetical protein RMT77_000517 [Armadillidium vulgare]
MKIFNVANHSLLIFAFLLLVIGNFKVSCGISKEECEAISGGVYCPKEFNCVIRSDKKVTTSVEAQQFCEGLRGDLPDFSWEMMSELLACFDGTPYKTAFTIFTKPFHKEHKCASIVFPTDDIQTSKFLHNECELTDGEASVLCHIHI